MILSTTTNDRFCSEDQSDGDIGNTHNGTVLGASYETVDLLVFGCESTLWYLRVIMEKQIFVMEYIF
jgi:hypothetical protein